MLFDGINISSTDYFGDTVLHKAIEKGLLENTILLIDKGVEMDACNNKGVTSLHLASKHGHYDPFRLLLNSGANVNPVTRHTEETLLKYTASADSIATWIRTVLYSCSGSPLFCQACRGQIST